MSTEIQNTGAERSPIVTQENELQELYSEYQRDTAFDDLRRMSGIKFVRGYGPFNPALMLIGHAPGKYENMKGIPFIGPNRKLVRQILNEAHIDLKDIFYTNTVKYWPLDPANVGSTRQLSDEEQAITSEYLRREIDIVDPLFVGLCGRPAIQSLFPEITEVFKHNGELLDSRCVALYHPAGLLYDNSDEKFKLVKHGFEELQKYISESNRIAS